MSEEKIVDFCSEKLDINLSSTHLERVHRLGKYASSRERPITANMTFYKDKERMLSAARKLKGSEFSIREDFCPATREARRKLIEFAKARQKFFKLSVDRMRIDDATYVHDRVKSTVVQLSR